jgi:hypothetical protein
MGAVADQLGGPLSEHPDLRLAVFLLEILFTLIHIFPLLRPTILPPLILFHGFRSRKEINCASLGK